MASKRAEAIRREKAEKEQASSNERIEQLLLAIAEKVGVFEEKSSKAGQDPEPAELAEVTETPQEKEEDEKVDSEADEDSDEDVDPEDGETGLGW